MFVFPSLCYLLRLMKLWHRLSSREPPLSHQFQYTVGVSVLFLSQACVHSHSICLVFSHLVPSNEPNSMFYGWFRVKQPFRMLRIFNPLQQQKVELLTPRPYECDLVWT